MHISKLIDIWAVVFIVHLIAILTLSLLMKQHKIVLFTTRNF